MLYKASAYLEKSLLVWGKVETIGSETLCAGKRHDLNIKITLLKNIGKNITFEIWTHFVSDMEMFQDNEPKKNAYLNIKYKNIKLKTNVDDYAKIHGDGTYFPYKRVIKSALPSDVKKGEEINVNIKNIKLQSFEEKLFNLRFVLMENDNILGYIGDAAYEIKGTVIDHLRLIVPTVVSINEKFDCKIVVCDKYENKTSDNIKNLDFEIAQKNLKYEKIEYDPKLNIFNILNIFFKTEGIYYINLSISSMRNITGISNPVVVNEKPEKRIYWGDMHQHAYYADGRGTPYGILNYTRSNTFLDFGSICDHVTLLDRQPLVGIKTKPQKGWEEITEAYKKTTEKDFIAYPGYEENYLRYQFGDFNIYYYKIDENIKPVDMVLGREPKSYQELLDNLPIKETEILIFPHSHAGGDPEREKTLKLPGDIKTTIEICSVHGVFEDLYKQYLDAGHRIGVNGGSDNHMASMGNANPGVFYPNTNGLTAAVVEKKSRRDIWNSFGNRNTYAVTGNKRIYLDFKINSNPMGECVKIKEGSANCLIKAAGTSPIMKIELIKNGEILNTYRPALKTKKELRIVWTDTLWARRWIESIRKGSISQRNSDLKLKNIINKYNQQDIFTNKNGEIQFCSSGYSSVYNGVILKPGSISGYIDIKIEDYLKSAITDQSYESIEKISGTEEHQVLLDELITIQLDNESFNYEKIMNIKVPEFLRKNQDSIKFKLKCDWIDSDWSKTAQIEWKDKSKSGDYYYIKVEQVDGNFAWSSPIWIE